MKYILASDSTHYKRWRIDLGLTNALDPGYITFLAQIAAAKGLKRKLDIEVEIALLVYEDALSLGRSRRIRANRTRPLLRELGVAAGVAQVVFGNYKKQIGWGRLKECELLEYSFEKIILDNPDEFSHLDDFDELIRICKSRLLEE